MTVKEKAKQIAKLLRKERPDYFYLKALFRNIRQELNIEVARRTKNLPYVPTEEVIKKYYDIIFRSQNMQNAIIVKTMLYTGVRVGELVNIKLEDIDLASCNIRINKGKGNKDRIVPFPQGFREVLAMQIKTNYNKKATHLFESSWGRPYSVRGIRKILAQYTKAACMTKSISPHKLRHFLFTWMKKQGVDDALIQPYSGHESRKSLEVYSKLSITDAQKEYEKVIKQFPI